MANRYWRLREEQNRKQNIQDEKAYDREINSIYEQAFDEIQDEINLFYGKYARKEGISMAEAKKRVSRLDIEEYERKAARYVAEKNFSDKANEEMRLYNTTMKINRLEMLKSDIALRLTGAADKADKYSGKVLTEATRKELERQAGILGGTVHASNTQMAEKIVKSPFRNATYSERVWNNASTIQYDLEKELRRTLIQGKAMDFSRLGPFAKCQERAKADARRLLKTELVRCRSEAQKAEYEENGFDEYEFMCLGSHPCEICQGLNGKHFPVRDLAKNMGEFAPPIHPNCRCTTAPWVDEEAYNDWLNAKADGSFSGGFDEWKQIDKIGVIRFSGAYTDVNDPMFEKRNAAGERIYAEIRNRKRQFEIEAVAKNSGFSIEEVDIIFSHIFEKEHLFENGRIGKFDSDYYMAQSWLRLREGKYIQEHDIVLLHHELEEAKIMNADVDVPYEKAHNEVNKIWNYKRALLEYLKSHEA